MSTADDTYLRAWERCDPDPGGNPVDADHAPGGYLDLVARLTAAVEQARADRGRVALGAQQQHADVEQVEAQVQDRVVELAERPQRPQLVAGRVDRLRALLDQRAKAPRAVLEAWNARVRAALHERLAGRKVKFILLAGEKYSGAVLGLGAEVEEPLKGLTTGPRRSWLAAATAT